MLDKTARGRVDLAKIRRHWPDVLRVIASVHTREISAHDVIRVLQHDGRLTDLGEAVAHYGRIFKTLHVLTFADDPGYRRHLKGMRNLQEQRHGLGRHVIHGRKGELYTDAAEWQELDEFLFARAMEHDSPKLLFRLACEFLISGRVARPGVVHLLEHVATARSRAREETWARVEHLLSDRRRAELDLLLVPDAYLGRTPLAWLGVGPTSSSPAAVKAELEKLAYLRRLDAHTMDLSGLPEQRRRFLAGVGRRLTGQALQRREPQRRYTILLTVLAQSAVDVLDETLLLFDQAISGRESAAKAKMTEALAERARGGENCQQLLDEILAIVLDPVVGDEQVGGLIRSRVGMERLRGAWAVKQERLPRDHGHLAMMDPSMTYLRQFAPAVLAAVQFAGGPVPRTRPQRPPRRSEDDGYTCDWRTRFE